ncbi:MAG: hypothetical protein FWF81_00065, partial [Defluviitaleaceae bacterium]|nr:hypothetical protein [Defluviitaleaceae bacterium]
LAVRYKAYKEFMQGKTVYQFFQDHFTITYSYNDMMTVTKCNYHALTWAYGMDDGWILSCRGFRWHQLEFVDNKRFIRGTPEDLNVLIASKFQKIT